MNAVCVLYLLLILSQLAIINQQAPRWSIAIDGVLANIYFGLVHFQLSINLTNYDPIMMVNLI